MSLFMKALAFSSLALAGAKANSATFNCKSLSGTSGGQVQLTTSGNSLANVAFALTKDGQNVGRIDFAGPPTEVAMPNQSGNKVSFLRYHDSFQSVNFVVTSLLFAEKSLLTGESRSGLVTFQQQTSQQYLCQLATK